MQARLRHTGLSRCGVPTSCSLRAAPAWRRPLQHQQARNDEHSAVCSNLSSTSIPRPLQLLLLLPSRRARQVLQPKAAQSHAQQPAKDPRTNEPDGLNAEIFSIALPMLATLAADPIAGLVDAAYIGRLGPVELAGVGVALSMFNTVSKLFNMPLLSVTTSAVASASGRSKGEGHEEAVAAAMSSALLIAVIVGLFQAAMLAVNASWASGLWGVGAASPLRDAVTDFLLVRAIGAPVTTLLLVLQGVYRGLQDTRTPFYATLASSVLNVILNPILIFGCGLGVKGAAIGTVVAQALPCALLLWRLASTYRLRLDPPALRQVVQLFGPTFYTLLRTMAITVTYALATSLVTRAGPSAAACHQVCFQVWLASSLLADSLAVASQTLLARSIAAGDYEYGRKVVDRTVSMAGGLGLALMALLALARNQLPLLFTKDPQVLALFAWVLPFVVLTQPINSLAFVWDGVLFGAGGFRYASVQMAMCAVPAITVMFLGNQLAGGAAGPVSTLIWVWAGLATVMAGRAASIYLPYKLRLPPFATLWAGADGSASSSGSSGSMSGSSEGSGVDRSDGGDGRFGSEGGGSGGGMYLEPVVVEGQPMDGFGSQGQQ